MEYTNQMKLTFSAVSENEPFARNTVAAFCLPLRPSVSEINDVKTAVSEAVTNCIVHGYGGRGGEITIVAKMDGEKVHVSVADNGCGIEDVARAREPFFTTLAEEERSGMGFTIMQTFMTGFSVKSEKDKGTQVCMSKKIGVAENGEIRERVNA